MDLKAKAAWSDLFSVRTKFVGPALPPQCCQWRMSRIVKPTFSLLVKLLILSMETSAIHLLHA